MSVTGRDHLRLFVAMNEVLDALSADGREDQALRVSFEAAAKGFGAQKALLLLVESQAPLCLRCLHARGELSREQVKACERGNSVAGVSPTLIRRVIASRRAELIEDPRESLDLFRTHSLRGASHSVLCAPILDTLQDSVLAVIYFQNAGQDDAYHEVDRVWLEGYVTAIGKAFGIHFARQRQDREVERVSQDRPENAPELIGRSAHVQELRREFHEVHIPALDTSRPDPILILGERGTGKDLVARYLHAYSRRGDRALVAVNCAEITDELAAARFFGSRKGAFTGAVADEPGLFRSADGGVLFLDEVADLSPRGQACLLRVLENHTVVPVGATREIPVDVAVILATNSDLDRAAQEGRLRSDFYDRFRMGTIRLLPLRERPWDIPALLEHFLAFHERRARKRTLGLTVEATRALCAYGWPGNVRELARLCSLLVTRAKPGARIDLELLQRSYPEALRPAAGGSARAVLADDVPLRDALRAFERELIQSRLERLGSSRAAMQSLRLTRSTFHRYVAHYGIALPRRRTGEKDDEA